MALVDGTYAVNLLHGETSHAQSVNGHGCCPGTSCKMDNWNGKSMREACNYREMSVNYYYYGSVVCCWDTEWIQEDHD